MNVNLIYLNIHLLLNIEIIPGCKLLHMMQRFWHVNMKFTFSISVGKTANFYILSVVIFKFLQDW